MIDPAKAAASRKTKRAQVVAEAHDLGGGWSMRPDYPGGVGWRLDGPGQPPRFYLTKEKAVAKLRANRERWEAERERNRQLRKRKA